MAETQSGLPMLFSFLLISIVIFSTALVYIESKTRRNRIDIIDVQTLEADKQLEDATRENDLLELESKARDANLLLSGQNYYSQVIDYLSEKLTDNVFARSVSIEIDKGNILVKLLLNSKDYLSISEQLYILKNSNMVENVEIGEIEENDDNSIDFELDVSVKKDLIRYNEEIQNSREKKVESEGTQPEGQPSGQPADLSPISPINETTNQPAQPSDQQESVLSEPTN